MSERTPPVSATSRQVVLARRPKGTIAVSDFELRSVALPELGGGEVLVRNLWMSVDPYMRLYLSELSGHHQPLDIGAVLEGAAVGEVTESRSDDVPVGSLVLHRNGGWKDAYVAPAAELVVLDPSLGPVQRFLGIYGLTGLTAYGGTMEVLDPQAGETMFVSGAAGAVGSVVVQLAKHRGASVIASTGSDMKRRWLIDDLGADAVINYRTEPVRERLAALAPGGIDMYFDNVGGEQLEAAIDLMKPQGRIALCGAIAQYDSPNYRAGPSNMFAIIEKCLTVRGFNARMFRPRAPQIIDELADLIERGRLVWSETVTEGLQNAVGALGDMLAGRNTGKMLVRL